MSATKSIIALLIGIAIDKGHIKSSDDKVLDYFPDYKIKRGEKTIHQALFIGGCNNRQGQDQNDPVGTARRPNASWVHRLSSRLIHRT